MSLTPEEFPVGDETEALVKEVGKRLAWNVKAYGSAWTGEDEDTRFILGPVLERIAELEAREAELRDALVAIASDTGYRGGVLNVGTRAASFDFARDLARTALADSRKPDPEQ